jgi:RNA polymerase sigma factor (sigma-70 family)
MSTLSFSINNVLGISAAYKCGLSSSDDTLLEGCLKQDRLAQKYLYQRYAGYMLGICMRYASSRDEALEMLNMAFYKIFKSISQYNGQGTLKAWMSKVVMHASIDWVRSNLNYRKYHIDFENSKDVPIDNEALEAMAVEELYHTIQQLPDSSRMVFSLFVIERYSHKEIGSMLNISAGTSKWHLSEAKKKLQQILKPMDHEG